MEKRSALPGLKLSACLFTGALVVCLLFSLLPFSTSATENPAAVPQEVGIVEHLGGQVNPEITLTDSSGKIFALKDLLQAGKPLILSPVYFSCPRLCKLTASGIAELLNSLDLKLGQDFKVLTFSFNSRESAELSSQRAKTFRKLLNKETDRAGWIFATGSDTAVLPLTDQIGFKFKPDGDDFEHTSAIVVITPAGKISRYFYGVDFPTAQVRYALVEAAGGRIGSTLDRAFLYCFRYDNTTGRYTPIVWNIVRVVSILVCVCVSAVIATLLLRERRRRYA